MHTDPDADKPRLREFLFDDGEPATKSQLTPAISVGPSYVDDHGGWSYTTFIADAPGTFWPSFDGETPEESAGWGWFTSEEMKKVPLHPGFKASLPKILAAGKAIQKVGPKGYVHGWVYVGPPDSYDAVRHPEFGDGQVTNVHGGKATVTFDFAGDHTFDYKPSQNISGLYRTSEVPEEPAEDLKSAEKRLDEAIAGITSADPVFSKKPYDVVAARNPLGNNRGAAIYKYVTPAGNEMINGYLRTLPADGAIKKPDVSHYVEALDKEAANNITTKPSVLYRGFAAPHDVLSRFTPGQEVTDQAYVSTASDPHKAAIFAALRAYGKEDDMATQVTPRGGKPVIMKVNVPAGSHMFQGQSDLTEWVLPRGSRFKVTGVEADGTVIDMDALPPAGVARTMTQNEKDDTLLASMRRATASYKAEKQATQPYAARLAWGPDDITFSGFTAASAIIKVGREGYIHGWVCVRPPCGDGDAITHILHGDGTMHVNAHGVATGKFGDGVEGLLGDEVPARATTGEAAPLDDTMRRMAADLTLEVGQGHEDPELDKFARQLKMTHENQDGTALTAHPLTAKYFKPDGGGSGPLDRGAVRVTGDVRDENGEKAGEWARDFTLDDEGLVAHHEKLVLDLHAQGRGFAREFNHHSEEVVYKPLGIHQIKLHADIDVGGFAWARDGYDWVGPKQAGKIISRMRDELEDDSHGPDPDGRADWAKLYRAMHGNQFGSAGYPTPYDMSQAGWRPGKTEWLGKTAMLGSSWYAVKHL
jgi:hypothetical protein